MPNGALLAAAAAFLLLAKSGRSRSNLPECQPLTDKGGDLAGMNYLEFVTAGADPNARLPMIVSLHGLGYDKTAHIKWLESLAVPARIILPNAPFTQGGNDQKRTWWPSYSNTNLQKASKGLSEFASLIQQCRPTSGRPVITGHSMGGFVALDFATQFPQLISAAVPVAATRSSALWDIEPGVPVHGVHGAQDNSFAAGKAYYDAMADRGLDVAFTPVPGGHHRLAKANAKAWRAVLSELIH